MKNELIGAILTVFVVAGICFTAFICGHGNGIKKAQEKAVEMGVAKWEVVDYKGTIKFTWITNSLPNTLTE